MTHPLLRNFSLVLSLFITQSLLSHNALISNDSILTNKIVLDKNILNSTLTNIAPILTATGNQVFCPGTAMNIVTDFTITDPDDTEIDAIYVQISSGYINGQDLLTLTGSHPTIVSSWNATAGKLTLSGVSGQPTYVDFIAAVKDIVYSNAISNPSGIRNFSISVGQANYLPSNGHYYQYIPNTGISWSSAKAAAQISTYYGLQGYLATITSADEAQLSGKQAAGAGWIGGSDAETEGIWKWMTGPEIGTVFWNGGANGSTPNFAFWNSGEPNQAGDEDYTHVTAPGVGVLGSWNDLSNTGEPSGNYQPKGYIAEYGGTPGDPVLHISTSTTITIPFLNPTTQINNCGPASFTLHATATNGIVKWYQDPTGGTPLATGDDFTTPILNTTTTYYLDAYEATCSTGVRVPLIVNIKTIPIVTANSSTPVCGNNSTTISASTTAGEIHWYENPTGGNPIAIGPDFVTPILSQTTIYYAEGYNNGCLSLNRTPVTAFVYLPPTVTDEEVIICENSVASLNAGINNVTYLWSTGDTTEKIFVFSPGIYTVTVTSLPPENCSSIKTITVIEHSAPIIENVIVKDTQVTIIASGFGDFEYSIDDFNYQDSNIFNIQNGGQYTAFVKEKKGCGGDSQTFVVLSIPPFFTPNHDGYNDYWTIAGLQYYPGSTVKIFDKSGKLIIELYGSNLSWDGTFNGQNLPSTDYWYNFSIDKNQPENRGHFSLLR